MGKKSSRINELEPKTMWDSFFDYVWIPFLSVTVVIILLHIGNAFFPQTLDNISWINKDHRKIIPIISGLLTLLSFFASRNKRSRIINWIKVIQDKVNNLSNRVDEHDSKIDELRDNQEKQSKAFSEKTQGENREAFKKEVLKELEKREENKQKREEIHTLIEAVCGVIGELNTILQNHDISDSFYTDVFKQKRNVAIYTKSQCYSVLQNSIIRQQLSQVDTNLDYYLRNYCDLRLREECKTKLEETIKIFQDAQKQLILLECRYGSNQNI